MANRKKKTVTQFGKQSPQYCFFLNPYEDMRFTKCPQCDNKMHQRKLPLLIHIDPTYLLSLNKTCRYCPHCDLLIAHQNDVEHFLASYFMQQKPEVVGNDYLVVGTLDKTMWMRGTQQQMSMHETLDALHDFKEVVTFKVTGGWMRDEAESSTKK
jgi:hypothetical protein